MMGWHRELGVETPACEDEHRAALTAVDLESASSACLLSNERSVRRSDGLFLVCAGEAAPFWRAGGRHVFCNTRHSDT